MLHSPSSFKETHVGSPRPVAFNQKLRQLLVKGNGPRPQWEVAKERSPCFATNLWELVGRAVSFDDFVVWLACAVAAHHMGGIDYPGAPAVVTAAYAALGHTRGGFMWLTVGHRGHCKDIIKLQKTAIERNGVEPWRRNGPDDICCGLS